MPTGLEAKLTVGHLTAARDGDGLPRDSRASSATFATFRARPGLRPIPPIVHIAIADARAYFRSSPRRSEEYIMTRSTRFTALAAALALAAAPTVALAGAPKGNIVAAAMQSTDHKTLVAAVKAAKLVDTLAGKGPFTVFAPTDAAFAKLPAGTVETLLKPDNRSILQAVLTYHVVAGKVTAAELVAAIQANGGAAQLTTVQGGILTARLAGGNVLLTDAKGGTAKVVTADLMQSNGVIHVTDAVSLPM